MKPLAWAVIGAGRFGLIHARTIASLPGCELAGLANRNPARLAEASARFPGIRTTLDSRDLLQDPGIDVVSIATHWQEHHEAALAALAAGKHVLLEKPMAATSAQCREILRAADSSPGHLMVGHVCRFDPRVALAKAAIDAGRLGRIVSMHARRNLPKAPGSLRLDKISPLLGDGVHDADLMMWFAGRAPSEIYGRVVRAGDYRYPDLGWAMLHFGDEAIGVVETAWCLPESTPTVIDAVMEVIGTEGKLTIDCSATGLTVTDARGPKMADTVYWPEPHGFPAGALRAELEYFARCIRENRRPEIITPLEAARALAAMETAELSAERRQPLAFDFNP